VAIKPKARQYAIARDPDGRLTAEGGSPLDAGPEWTPEHLVLAALASCSVIALEYHARRANIELSASASASGIVAPRTEDGTYAFIEVGCRIEAQLDPLPGPDTLRILLAKAERGCFVGSSLTAKPRYRWIVNGQVVE
jgi:organic hydroperoxide reductase OsmC/OhrA